ncbi:MAG: magnesium-translocating P-type ATPase [Candidatus Melainabacteria bacterium]|nr:magnesium-translocating P-type ATPase [Candidatus Melainabacteria bacterium]
MANMQNDIENFWSINPGELLNNLNSSLSGLSENEASKRLESLGNKLLSKRKATNALVIFLNQFKNPIILILIFAVVLSLFLRDFTDSLIILIIIFFSGVLSFFQEYSASNAVDKLLSMVKIKVDVIRDKNTIKIDSDKVVPGDIILLSAGSLIPADCLLIETKDFFVNETAFTGETYPVEKNIGLTPNDIPISKRTNSIFMGTSVISGTAKAIVVKIGKDTEFGKISEELGQGAAETEFEHGIKQFGYLLMKIMLVIVAIILLFNIYVHRPLIDSILFSLAIAVGITPQLLPAIISINLSHGAKNMAKQKVIVKRLSSIENLGSMNILCSDKTGTLTEGKVKLQGTLDINNNKSEKVGMFAYLNSFFERGYINPIDEAVRKDLSFDLKAYKKIDELPYDFNRKCLSILVSERDSYLLITKGAVNNILAACKKAETPSGEIVDLEALKEKVDKMYKELSLKGFRTLGVAYRRFEKEVHVTKEHESEMVFLGFITLYDPPKERILNTINDLKKVGVKLKVITGDNKLIAQSVCEQIGLINPRILSGDEIKHINDLELEKSVQEIDIFAEIEPNQKEKIVLALKKVGNVVGYMGDGINDATALHSADVGISVDTAVDVAKEAADIVLLDKDLEVVIAGIKEGRKTFANTLKYIFISTSANFGDMFSMAGASLFLPFFPLFPKQILLDNLLTDFPSMAIATDNVDSDFVNLPKRWNINFIKKFMLTFGLLSSFFDYLTFGILYFILHAKPEEFRTGWFMESVICSVVIALIIRTRGFFWKSKPSIYLFTASIIALLLVFIFTWDPFLSKVFGFTLVPNFFIVILGTIVMVHILVAELVKVYFYKKVSF